jgi:hypothetical protein
VDAAFLKACGIAPQEFGSSRRVVCAVQVPSVLTSRQSEPELFDNVSGFPNTFLAPWGNIFMTIDDHTISFNALLQQALTFGVKKITPSRLPQFIGFIVYGGLVAAIWASFSFGLDRRVIGAGIVLLLVMAIMTLLLLMGATISPSVLNALVIVVVVGFLAVSGYSVVEIMAPDSPLEVDLDANLQYADGQSADNFIVRLEGHQIGVTTGLDGYFDLPILKADIHDQKVHLHIESRGRNYAEQQVVSIDPASAKTRTTVVLRLKSPTASTQPETAVTGKANDQQGNSSQSPPPQASRDLNSVSGSQKPSPPPAEPTPEPTPIKAEFKTSYPPVGGFVPECPCISRSLDGNDRTFTNNCSGPVPIMCIKDTQPNDAVDALMLVPGRFFANVLLAKGEKASFDMSGMNGRAGGCFVFACPGTQYQPLPLRCQVVGHVLPPPAAICVWPQNVGVVGAPCTCSNGVSGILTQ